MIKEEYCATPAKRTTTARLLNRFVKRKAGQQTAASCGDQISRSSRVRLLMFAGFGLVLIGLFFNPLRLLIINALSNELNSHAILVPFISSYLIYIRRRNLPNTYQSSLAWAILPLVGAIASLVVATTGYPSYGTLNNQDYLTFTTLSFVCFLVTGGFILLGREWLAAVAFPIVFLIFMVPLPKGAVNWLENASKLGSAEMASFLFNLIGMPVLRDGTIFQLPGIVIEVAQECSGIRSSLVLLIASVLSAYLFLKRLSNRLVLVGAAIPLGILRNGFRIVVIGLLCVHFGPGMIHSPIHRQGGPLFFILSLIPLFFVLLVLRRKESTRKRQR